MIDRILNGLGDSSSSRSGAATTYSISTPSGTYTGLTKEQYDAWKAAVDHYTNAYGIAYSYDLTAPNWSEFTMTNGQSIVDSYVQKALNSGKKSKSESWQTFVETRAAQLAPQTQAQAQTQPQQQAQPQTQVQTEPQMTAQYWATPYIQECIAYAKANNYPMPSRQWVESYGPKALDKLKEMVAERDRTGINIPDPYNVQPLPTAQPAGVQPAEKKQGSGLLIPGLLLVTGIVGAILLTKKSRR
ncbi:MAG: hypothetical protein IIU97_01000 [Bacteroidaceae bacterium]|nr:hypothetical protein [Bacteroidaceae bacterium]